jgi:hypothetical protein
MQITNCFPGGERVQSADLYATPLSTRIDRLEVNSPVTFRLLAAPLALIVAGCIALANGLRYVGVSFVALADEIDLRVGA